MTGQRQHQYTGLSEGDRFQGPALTLVYDMVKAEAEGVPVGGNGVVLDGDRSSEVREAAVERSTGTRCPSFER